MRTAPPTPSAPSTSPGSLAQAQPAVNADRININEEASLSYWVAALDCSELQLRVAVAEVGPAVADVGTELGRCV